MMKIDQAIQSVQEGADPQEAIIEILGNNNPTISFASSSDLLRAIRALSMFGYDDDVDFQIGKGNSLIISKLIYKNAQKILKGASNER